MKKYNLITSLFIVLSIFYSYAEEETRCAGYSYIFLTSRGVNIQLVFNINPNKISEFNSISIVNENKKIEIDSSEIDINLFKSIDNVRLFYDHIEKYGYVFIQDKHGVGARKENRPYRVFSG